MNERDRLDRLLTAWTDEAWSPPAPAYLGEVLARTRRTRQRPAWASVERWLPMELTLQRPMLALPMRPLAIVLPLPLLLIAAMSAPLLFGTRSLPATVATQFRNGLVAYEWLGDILVGDPAVGSEKVLVGGMTVDTEPEWSPDGSRLSFWRGSGDARALMVVDADGSNLIALTATPAIDPGSKSWSPDGSRIAFVSLVDDVATVSLAMANGSGDEPIDVGVPVVEAAWHPAGDALLVRTNDDDGVSLRPLTLDGILGPALARSDTSSELLAAYGNDFDLYGATYSPDGSSIAYTNGVTLDGRPSTRGYPFSRSYIIRTDGTPHDDIEFSSASDDEDGITWSPDGSRVSIHVRTGADDQVEIRSVDGSSPLVLTERVRNPESWLGHAWAPDGMTLLMWTGGGRSWTVDSTTGEATPLPWTGAPLDWQPIPVTP